MPHEWTPEQLAVFEAMARGQGHLQIKAFAGSSKTSSLEEGARRAELSALYLVFNKRNQLEAQARMPATIQCRTVNSIGHGALMKQSKVTLDTDKLAKITREILRGASEDLDFGNILNLARKARVVGLVPQGAPGTYKALVPDTLDAWDEIGSTFDLDTSARDIDYARKILRSSISMALGRTATIDFDDQIYMPTLFGGAFTKHAIVLVDEAQDLSPIQHHMVRKSLAPDGRVISVGDPHQAIYGFRGADHSSMDTLADMFPGDELYLSCSFRCPRAVVHEAQTIVPRIQSWSGAPEGAVERPAKWRAADIEPRSAILCRNNAPLLTVAWELLAEGKGVSVLGTDIGKGLIKLIHKLAPTGTSMERFIPLLDGWAAHEIAIKPANEAKIMDKVESIKALASRCATTIELTDVIDRLFSDKTSLITLSSIHKAKGLEWPHVYFLDKWRIPSPYAKQPWERTQEANALYVGITRAQHTLTYIDVQNMEA